MVVEAVEEEPESEPEPVVVEVEEDPPEDGAVDTIEANSLGGGPSLLGRSPNVPVFNEVEASPDEDEPGEAPSLHSLLEDIPPLDDAEGLPASLMELEWPEEEELPTERHQSQGLMNVDMPENMLEEGYPEPDQQGLGEFSALDDFEAMAPEFGDPEEHSADKESEESDLLFPEEIARRKERNDLLSQALGDDDDELAWTEERNRSKLRLLVLTLFLTSMVILGVKLWNTFQDDSAPVAEAPEAASKPAAPAVADAEQPATTEEPGAEEAATEEDPSKPAAEKVEEKPAAPKSTSPPAKPAPKVESKPEPAPARTPTPEPAPEPKKEEVAKTSPPTSSDAASPWGSLDRTARPDDPPAEPPPLESTGNANARGFANAGWSSLGAKQYEQARREFVEAVALAPTDADAHYGLAYAAQKQGDTATSVRHYCKALKYGSRDRDLQLEVEALLGQLGGSCE